MKALRRWLPAAQWLSTYDKDDFASDLTAGIITAVLLVPQGMAYALLAGLPPQSGLYASILPLILYGLFGTSRALAVGPVAIASLMTASSLANVTETVGIGYIEAAMTLALMSGVIYIAMGIVRVGFLVNFMSHHVIAGFTSAAGLVIAFSQLKHILGIDLPRTHRIDQVLVYAGEQWQAINPATLAIGVAAIAGLLLARGPLPRWLTSVGMNGKMADRIGKGSPLLIVVAATFVAWLWDLNATQAVKIVGQIPTGMPPIGLPILDPAVLQALLPAALLITFVGYLESISVARALASKRRQKIDANQELFGLGAANIAAGLSGAYPVAGGFGRSVVNFSAGARTPMASAITAALVLFSSLFLTPLLYNLPKAALAAIILIAVLNLVDFASLRQALRYNRADAAAMLLTFAAVLSVGVEHGIMLGIAAALALHLWRTSRPHIAIVGRVGKSEHFRNVLRHKVHTEPNLLMLRVDESLYFANTGYLENYIMEQVADRPDVRHLVLICSAVNFIDSSALEGLERLTDELRDAGVRLHLAEVKGPVMDRLHRSDFFDHFGDGKVFLSTHDAMCELTGNGTNSTDRAA
jgi:SulP family sulfate permease